MQVITMNAAVMGFLQHLSAEDLGGSLVILEPGKVRLRKKP